MPDNIGIKVIGQSFTGEQAGQMMDAMKKYLDEAAPGWDLDSGALAMFSRLDSFWVASKIVDPQIQTLVDRDLVFERTAERGGWNYGITDAGGAMLESSGVGQSEKVKCHV